MWNNLQDHEMVIPGHKLILPLTNQTMNHSRIVLIAKMELNVSIQTEYMDNSTATVWVKVGNSRNSSIIIEGIYREHQQLGLTDPNATHMEIQREQEKRWCKIVKNWKAAGQKSKCVIIGDLNLDYNRWEDPEQHLVQMVDLTKEHIETEGFSQLITGITRVWRDQTDSTLDHIWVNCPQRVVNHSNLKRGSSDHNVITVIINCSDMVIGGMNTNMRCWKKFQF